MFQVIHESVVVIRVILCLISVNYVNVQCVKNKKKLFLTTIYNCCILIYCTLNSQNSNAIENRHGKFAMWWILLMNIILFATVLCTNSTETQRTSPSINMCCCLVLLYMQTDKGSRGFRLQRHMDSFLSKFTCSYEQSNVE